MSRAVMQWRFREHIYDRQTRRWIVSPWCTWTDLPGLYTFDLPTAVQVQFRRKPRKGETPDFCPCGFMDRGSCGPAGCPKVLR